MPQDFWANAIFSLVPTTLVSLLFWWILRAILRGDRIARKVYNEIEAEERAKAGLPPKAAATPVD